VFQFGYNGSPLYIPGPNDTPRQIERRRGQYLQHEEAGDAAPVVQGATVLLDG
jgi:hypothetical protein